MKGNAQPPANALHALAVVRELALVFGPDGIGVEVKIALAFDILKQHRAVKIKSEFVRIEHLENDHFMPGGGEPAEIALQFIDRREQIGDQHDQAAFAHEFRHAAQRRANWFRCRRLVFPTPA